jgi:glycogen(starch) synthase
VNRPRVLKLGWEFPPLINGGLGIACLGLSRALAERVDLRVIVPKADPATKFDGFDLTGLNNTTVEELLPAEKRYRYESFAKIERVPIHLDPYDEGETTLEEAKLDVKEVIEFARTSEAQLDQFKIGELYGGDLGTKVVEFSKVAAKLAMQAEFDLVHAHDWMTFLAGVEVKKATGRPLVVHLHASLYDRAGPDARGWIFDIEKYGMEQADRVIPVSNYTGRIVADHYGIDADKIRPVHNGAEPVESFVTSKKFPEKLVLFLGRLTAQKGPEFFLEIAAKVLEQDPDVRFVMAGTGEKLRPLIESGAFRGLGGHFHFTGFLDKEKVAELLSMTDVYCMPSVSEPFGLSALEAAQFGIPAVISKQSGVAEVLEGALKADFWDVDLMAEHIVALLDDEELRQKVVKRAHEDIVAATWDAAAAKVVEVYREILEDAGSGRQK